MSRYQNAAWRRARNFFNLQDGWVLHHKDENLKQTDLQRYKEWRVDDLVPMTRSEHAKLHRHGRFSGTPDGSGWDIKGDKNPSKRPDVKKKISDAHKGMHWYNNGIINRCTYECPDGFVKGKLKR